MYRVLIVEDDPMVAMINGQYTERQKEFTIVGTCENGVAALAFLASGKAPVDLVLLDVHMPEMDGLATLRELRYRGYPVDVILVTAACDRETVQCALWGGCVDHLVKPFTYERFCAALQKFATLHTTVTASDTFPQKSLDRILDTARRKAGELPPKGIQEKTMQRICTVLRLHCGDWLTGDEIAAAVGLTSVTVRRYLQYLEKNGQVLGEIHYATGGRPCTRYRYQPES